MMSQLHTNLTQIRQVYWDSNGFDGSRSQAMNSTQPFVLVKTSFHYRYF